MKRNKIFTVLAYIVLIASIILLIWNITDLDFTDLKSNHYAGTLSSIFTTITIILVIVILNKQK